MVFLCIGLMLPAAPGFIGAYQFFIVAALQLFGVPDTTAFALAVFMNLYHIFLSFLAGLYGMNFDNMPELHLEHGYFFALAAMASTATLLIYIFKRKRWL